MGSEMCIRDRINGGRKKFYEMLEFVKAQKHKNAIVVNCVEFDALRKQGRIEIHFYKKGLIITKDSNSSDIMCWDNYPQLEKNKKFIPPTVEQVSAYCRERDNSVNAEKFVDFYQSKGWLVGKSKMKDWRAAVRNWTTIATLTKHSPVEIKDMAAFVCSEVGVEPMDFSELEKKNRKNINPGNGLKKSSGLQK